MMSVTGDRVQQELTRRGWDQSDLAERLGTTQASISRIVMGKTANSRLIPRIATVLGKPLPWLLGETDESDGEGEPLTTEERDWLELLRALVPKDRAALLHIARTMATSAATPTVQAKRHEFRREP